MRQIRDGLNGFWQQRDVSRETARQQRVIVRDGLGPSLLNQLRIALAILACDEFDEQIVPELEQWGYRIVERNNGRSAAPTAVNSETTETPSNEMNDPIDLSIGQVVEETQIMMENDPEMQETQEPSAEQT